MCPDQASIARTDLFTSNISVSSDLGFNSKATAVFALCSSQIGLRTDGSPATVSALTNSIVSYILSIRILL